MPLGLPACENAGETEFDHLAQRTYGVGGVIDGSVECQLQVRVDRSDFIDEFPHDFDVNISRGVKGSHHQSGHPR